MIISVSKSRLICDKICDKMAAYINTCTCIFVHKQINKFKQIFRWLFYQQWMKAIILL